MFNVFWDSVITDVLKKISSPVMLEPGNQQRIEKALERREGHWSRVVKHRLADRAHWFCGFIHLLLRSQRAPHDPANFLAVDFGRENRGGRNGQKSQETTDVFRCLGNKFPISLYNLRRLIKRPERDPGDHDFGRMHSEQEGSNDPEISAAATQGP